MTLQSDSLKTIPEAEINMIYQNLKFQNQIFPNYSSIHNNKLTSKVGPSPISSSGFGDDDQVMILFQLVKWAEKMIICNYCFKNYPQYPAFRCDFIYNQQPRKSCWKYKFIEIISLQ